MKTNIKLELPESVKKKLKKEKIKKNLKAYGCGAAVGLFGCVCYAIGKRVAVDRCDMLLSHFLNKHEDIKKVFKPAWEEFYTVTIKNK